MRKRRVSAGRRRVLRTLVVAGVVMGSPKWAASDPMALRLTPPVQHHLLWALAAELGRAESIDVFAAEFISRFPNKANVDTLTTTLLARMRSTDLHARLDTVRAVRDGLARSVREDFRAGRIENVDGWQLSSTELHLCALSKLMTAEQVNAALTYVGAE